MLPPTVGLLVRGTALVLGALAVVALLAGIATADALTALNAVGFTGTCALSCATVFYAVALERIGLHSARTAAETLVAVLAGSAVVATVLLVVLLAQARFRDEASRLGLHSVAGIAVLAVLAAALAFTWRDRGAP